MIRRPPRSTRTDTLFPYTTLFRSTAFGAFLEVTQEAMERMYRINLMGPFLLTQAAIPDMLKAGWGRVINISSSSAQTGRSEEHTSELQSLMRISYAVFCLKKKQHPIANNPHNRL